VDWELTEQALKGESGSDKRRKELEIRLMVRQKKYPNDLCLHG
jgi:hypothetical protein